MFYPEGFANFALEKSFVPKVTFFFILSGVRTWQIRNFCQYFSYYGFGYTYFRKGHRDSIKAA